MADTKKKKQQYKRALTPVGLAHYPWLLKPDTKFNPDGEFKCGVICKPKDAKAFLAQVDAEAKLAVKAAKVANPKYAKSIKQGDAPFENETNDKGKPTGNIIIKTKSPAVIKSKKTGETWNKTIALFDASGKKIKTAKIGGGSKIQLEVELRHYWLASSKTAGVSLRLQSAQIIDLKEYQGGDGPSAESRGFKKQKGYVAPEAGDDDESGNESSEDEELY